MTNKHWRALREAIRALMAYLIDRKQSSIPQQTSVVVMWLHQDLVEPARPVLYMTTTGKDLKPFSSANYESCDESN